MPQLKMYNFLLIIFKKDSSRFWVISVYLELKPQEMLCKNYYFECLKLHACHRFAVSVLVYASLRIVVEELARTSSKV